MEIKKGVINPGQIIKWNVPNLETMERKKYEAQGKPSFKYTEMVVKEIYSHHALCVELKPPYRRMSISYQQMYTMGIISCTDFVKEFTRR